MTHAQRLVARFHFHWFAYYNGWRAGRTLKLHHLRDAAAFHEFGEALIDRGGRYGRLFLNGPSTRAKFRSAQATMQSPAVNLARRNVEEVLDYRPVDDSFLKPGDTLVVVGRPPLNDLDQGERLQTQPGFTSLEQTLFRETRPYLEICSRGRLRCSPAIAEQLPPELADRGEIHFRMRKNARYLRLGLDGVGAMTRDLPPSDARTLGVVLHLPEVERLRGANALLVWGMGGTETLVLAHRLRIDQGHLLDRYGLTLIEMNATREREDQVHLDFALDWGFEELLHAEPL